MTDYSNIVKRLKSKVNDRRRGFQPSRFERVMLSGAAAAIELLSAEVKSARKIMHINTATGRAYWCDPFSDRQSRYLQDRDATDAAFKELP